MCALPPGGCFAFSMKRLGARGNGFGVRAISLAQFVCALKGAFKKPRNAAHGRENSAVSNDGYGGV